MPLKHLVIHVSGGVQGVGFRYSTLIKAEALGLTGTVRNEEDGSVLIHAEGLSEKTALLADWCRHGPSGAHVSHFEVREEPLKGFDSFRILH